MILPSRQLPFAYERRATLLEIEQIEALAGLSDDGPVAASSRVGSRACLDSDDVHIHTGNGVIGERRVGQKHLGHRFTVVTGGIVLIAGPGRGDQGGANEQSDRQSGHRQLRQKGVAQWRLPQ